MDTIAKILSPEILTIEFLEFEHLYREMLNDYSHSLYYYHVAYSDQLLLFDVIFLLRSVKDIIVDDDLGNVLSISEYLNQTLPDNKNKS